LLCVGLWFPPRRWGHNPLDGRRKLPVRSCRRREKGNEVDLSKHPTVEAVHEAVRAKGGSLSCPICGRDEFALEEVSLTGSGMAEGYGRRPVERGQLVCENCGGVVGIDLERLGAGAAAAGTGDAAAGADAAGPVRGVTDTVGGVTGSVSGITDKLLGGGGGEEEKRR
jgi:predicted nucleic-acid-binding Zn-ribbon protein